MFAYVFFMWTLALRNFKTRRSAIQNKAIQANDLKSFQNKFPDEIAVMGRHYDNQFQLPILFLITCTLHLTLKTVDTWTVNAAWAFIALRLGHSFEHLGRNRLIRRVMWFASGWLVVLALWIKLLVSVS